MSRRLLVFPMTAIANFKRCPTMYYLGYERGLEAIVDKQYVIDGTSFHAWMAAYAHERRGTPVPQELAGQMDASNDEMYEVHLAYIQHRGAVMFDDAEEIIAADKESEAVYLPIAVPPTIQRTVESVYNALGEETPETWVRMTHDLVYRRKSDKWIYAVDYKTFAQMPTYDYDLDFQARFYIAGLMQKFQTADVQFTFENVRRTVPAPKSKWPINECYVSQPMVIGVDEARKLWMETQFDVARILITRAWGRSAFSHTDLKGTSPHTCHTCFYKAPCKREYAGTFDAEAQAEMTRPRKPIILPDGRVAQFGV